VIGALCPRLHRRRAAHGGGRRRQQSGVDRDPVGPEHEFPPGLRQIAGSCSRRSIQFGSLRDVLIRPIEDRPARHVAVAPQLFARQILDHWSQGIAEVRKASVANAAAEHTPWDAGRTARTGARDPSTRRKCGRWSDNHSACGSGSVPGCPTVSRAGEAKTAPPCDPRPGS